MAEDFYEYIFECVSSFYGTLVELQGNIKIKNVIINNLSDKSFAKKYAKEKYEQEYNVLKKYADKSISELKKEKYLEVTGYEEYQTMKTAFDYKRLSINDRSLILELMDVPICPYCNMNYINGFYDKSSKYRPTADLEHFYIKSKYPQYSLCLYNLIPSCSICNSRLKGFKSMTREECIYPYEDSFDGKARFAIKNISQVIINQEDVDLIFQYEKDCSKVKKSVEIFEILPRYNVCKDLAKELIDKAQIYNETYREQLKVNFNNLGLNLNIKKFIFGENCLEKQFAKESRGKFRMDLLHQLGIY